MKRTIGILLSLSRLASLFLFAGCGKKEEPEIGRASCRERV